MKSEKKFRGDPAKIVKRLFSLKKIAEGLLDSFFDYSDQLKLNEAILLNCIESYFIDLNRAKEFHEIKNADKHKRAAYTIKWIAKLRPIQVLKTNKIDRAHLLVNELFALIAGVSFLDIEVEQVSEKYLANLLYIFRYRPLEGTTLASKMYLLEKAVQQDQP